MDPDRSQSHGWDTARWAPLLPAIACLVSVLWFTLTRPSPSVRHVSLVIAAVIWAIVALGVAFGPAYRVLSSRARKWPGAALLALALSCGSVWATFHWLPGSSPLPVLMALVHGSLSARRPVAALATWIFIPGLTVLLTDAALILLRNSATLIRIPAVRRVVGPLHGHDANVIQFMPECAQYDEELTYTLRPGQCVFEETEFRTTYNINSLGLRDDEDSVNAPVVVVCGDSVTMGWGVEQHETYPARVESLTGLKVLNAGISSYGTAREMALLHRIDRGGLRYLVVQYHGNDLGENRVLAARRETPRQSRTWYRRQQEYLLSERRYRPGNYLYATYFRETEQFLARRHHGEQTPPSEPARAPSPDWQALGEEVELFVNALATAPTDLESVELIIYVDDASLGSEVNFVQEFQRQLPASGLSERFARIHVLSYPEFGFTPDDRFLLDPHFNANGNNKIAQRLANLILQLERNRRLQHGS